MHWVCLLVLAGVCTIATARGDEVDDLVRKEMARHEIPGVAVAIVRTGAPTRLDTYGLANIELRTPVTTNSVFEIGSLTKQFTAACILLLSQEGKLSLQDRISRHLTNTPPAWSNVTIHHLLTHTAGIRNYTGLDGFELRRRLTQTQFIAALSVQPMDFAPGEQAKYSNSGYSLLGYIIENVSGRTYWDFLAARIWAPLGMRSSTNRDPVIVVPQRVDGYERTKAGLRNRDSDLTEVFAAGAIVSSLNDLLKWNAALDDSRLLSEASRIQWWTAARLNDGSDSGYGYGWRISTQDGRRNIGHSGSTSGFSASLQRYPDEGLTVIVLCNSDAPNIATTLARALARTLFQRP